jgi:hypothetical protein
MGESRLGSGGAFEVFRDGGPGSGVNDLSSRDERSGEIGRTTGPDGVASDSFGAAEKEGGESDGFEHIGLFRLEALAFGLLMNVVEFE